MQKFDLCTVTQEELDFEAPFSLTMTSDTKCHVCIMHVHVCTMYVSCYCVYHALYVHYCCMQAIVGYFDVGFDGVDFPLYMSTSPQDPPTHWKQTVFYLQEPIAVHTGKQDFQAPVSQWNPHSERRQTSQEFVQK